LGAGLSRVIDPIRRRKGTTSMHEYTSLLLKFLGYEIKYLLNMHYHSAAYGGILYERIDVIRLLLDGKLELELDLATELKKVRFDDSMSHDSFGRPHSHWQPQPFEDWRTNSYKRQVELRLLILLEESNSIDAQSEDNVIG
jgi:hypothetical protein